ENGSPASSTATGWLRFAARFAPRRLKPIRTPTFGALRRLRSSVTRKVHSNKNHRLNRPSTPIALLASGGAPPIRLNPPPDLPPIARQSGPTPSPIAVSVWF